MIIGVDPGRRGAYALLGAGKDEAHHLPYQNKRLDVAALLAALPPPSEVEIVVVERLGFRPKQSVQSGATQCINWGRLVGMLELNGYPIAKTTPQNWQKTVLGKVEQGESKPAAIAFAQRYYPGINLIPGRCKVPQDGLADAICLGHYGRVLLAAADSA